VTHIAQRNSGFQLTLNDTSLISARTLILCTGARPQRLYVQGEKEFHGRGVSFSAISHVQFFRGRTVAVVGGERALAAVLKLAAIANRVYYVIAQKKEMRGSHLSETILRNPKVQLFYDWEVQGIAGDDFVTGIDLVGVNGATRTLAVEGVFIEFGLLPNNELARDLVALDEEGHIIVNQRSQTNVPGLFAAGDVTNVYAEQVPVAIGEGAKAALSAWSYLATNG
jgi:thioredoxin reductase